MPAIDLHSNMVIFIMRRDSPSVVVFPIFTFQYGYIYYEEETTDCKTEK